MAKSARERSIDVPSPSSSPLAPSCPPAPFVVPRAPFRQQSGFGEDLAFKLASRKPSVLVCVDVQAEKGDNVAAAVTAKHGVKTVFRKVWPKPTRS